MSEPAKRTDLKLVDENFTADAKAAPADKLKAQLAASIREGRRRERVEATQREADLTKTHASFVAGMSQAQTAELDRAGKIIGKAAHRDGLLQGIVAGMAMAIALAFGTWIILREVVITNVATERVPRSAVPVLQDNYTPPEYERHPREPGTAQGH